jgi:hypothetical protein
MDSPPFRSILNCLVPNFVNRHAMSFLFNYLENDKKYAQNVLDVKCVFQVLEILVIPIIFSELQSDGLRNKLEVSVNFGRF